MKKLKPLFKKRVIIPVFFVLIIIFAVIGILVFKHVNSPKTTSGAAEISDLSVKVGKLIELPTGETPTVATVSDITKLKDQPFFANAKNGDKVLIYAKAKKAILYRPTENKLIEVALYNPPALAQTTPSPTKTTGKAKVALLNGTTIVGYTKTVEDQLQTKVPQAEVVVRDNASRSDYTKSIVVDLSGNNKALASSLASTLIGSVGSLPSGENTPQGVDILVILGSK